MRAVLLICVFSLAACGGGDHHGTGGGSGGGGGGQTALDLNDVSWLFPLPDWSHRDQLLGRHPGWRLATRDSGAMLFARIPALPEASTKESTRATR